MTFVAPALLLALAIVPIALLGYLLIQRRRSQYVVRFTNVDLLSNLAPRRPGLRRHLPPLLYLLALSALAVGLARPQMVVAVPREQATIVLTLDVSRSMEATDVSPTRLDAAQAAATDFVNQLPPQFKVALVTFSSSAQLLVPATTDHDDVLNAIARLRTDGGTALGDAIALSVEAAGVNDVSADDPASPPTPSTEPDPAPSDDPAVDDEAEDEAPVVATVLLSDGANSTGELDPITAAEQAAAANVPVYTIALGTDSGTVRLPNQFGFLETVPVPPDAQTLAAVAEITGARFFEAPTAGDLNEIYEALGSRVGFEEEQQEVTYLFAGLALAFVAAGGGLAALWFNRIP
jgi:Ca-activated chloride channel family protein